MFAYILDIPVSIGLQKGYYSAREDSGSIQICVEVTSGDITGRNISFNFTTADGSAKGSFLFRNFLIT